MSRGIRSSYTQVFFSENPWFAVILFLASFTDVYVGISGLLAVIIALVLGRLSGFNIVLLANGTYTYNVLLVGFTMGAYFRQNAAFFVVLLLASLLTLLLSVWLSASLARKKLPMLSLPFVLGIWIILLSVRNFHAMGLNERGIYLYNELWHMGGYGFMKFYLYLNALPLPSLLILYLKSMGAVFFQNHVLSGLLIAVGLLLFSRIAFSLSLIGFFSGYFFCSIVQGSPNDIEYSYIGFNYILTAMAIGGFFLVPSLASYILAALSVPFVSLFIGALGTVASGYMLSLYSLPFTLLVILMLYALYSRSAIPFLHPVKYQLFSPEKNLYLFRHYTERFWSEKPVQIHLPFYGEWTVSQAHEGKQTHKDDWRYALDFVVINEEEKTYRLPGEQLTDYYCYQLPVLAPADGEVVIIDDGISDNAVGQVNMAENWGNTIIIKHAECLYSKLSHLRSGSFKVKTGDFVKKGDLLALCGSSGRSPEPHLHFQMQAVPLVGAKTLNYPLSCYLNRKGDTCSLHTFEVPAEGDCIMRPLPSPLFMQAFRFFPGRKLDYTMNRGKGTERESWEVLSGTEGLSCLYCASSRSSAWFRNDGILFRFTSFSGDENSLLYYFYLAAQKILLSYCEGLLIKESMPVGTAYKGTFKWLQDMIAPFYLFLHTTSETQYISADHAQLPSRVLIRSVVKAYVCSALSESADVELVLEKGVISRIIVNTKQSCFSADYIG